jgi:hypothetical protein
MVLVFVYEHCFVIAAKHAAKLQRGLDAGIAATADYYPCHSIFSALSGFDPFYFSRFCFIMP